jgi:hypothetical protein
MVSGLGKRDWITTTQLSQVRIDSCVSDVRHTVSVFNKPNAKSMSCTQVRTNDLTPVPLGVKDCGALDQIWAHWTLFHSGPNFSHSKKSFAHEFSPFRVYGRRKDVAQKCGVCL